MVPPTASTELKQYLTSLLESTQSAKVHGYRNWWSTVEKNPESLDYYNIQPQFEMMIWVLSSFMSQPIATSIFEFLVKPGKNFHGNFGNWYSFFIEMDVAHQGLCFLSGDPPIPFKGKIRSLSISFLGKLSIRCRQRVLELIENVLFPGRNVHQFATSKIVLVEWEQTKNWILFCFKILNSRHLNFL